MEVNLSDEMVLLTAEACFLRSTRMAQQALKVGRKLGSIPRQLEEDTRMAQDCAKMWLELCVANGLKKEGGLKWARETGNYIQ